MGGFESIRRATALRGIGRRTMLGGRTTDPGGIDLVFIMSSSHLLRCDTPNTLNLAPKPLNLRIGPGQGTDCPRWLGQSGHAVVYHGLLVEGAPSLERTSGGAGLSDSS